jgi:hypothetical protein
METQVTEKTSPNLSLDTNDPVYATLTQCVTRATMFSTKRPSRAAFVAPAPRKTTT